MTGRAEGLVRALPQNVVRNAEIVRRRRAGEWPTDIARSMGLSRNAVIGVCNRAGLCSDEAGRQMSGYQALRSPVRPC